ncbi:MAG: hypothetical protein MI920_09360 [Kiloniellales bacterium]|nr:hypothetical protein [Kiloniellales bacterium]
MTAPNGFLRVDRAFVQGDKWQALSLGARCALLHIWAKFDGYNNADLRCGLSELQDALNCHRASAIRWLKELQDSGLLEAAERGGFRYRNGAREKRVTAWRLTIVKNLSRQK